MNNLLLKLCETSRINLIYEEESSNETTANFKDKSISSKIYSERFEDEMKVLEKLNQIENILLATQVKDIIKDMNIPFFIRGSAGGSFVLYVLGFTDIDPVKHNITFERFINQFRNSLGDIDFDLPRSFRNDVLKKIKSTLKKNGSNLAILCTKVFYKEKSALREAIRQVCNYRKFIPKEVLDDPIELDIFIRTVCYCHPELVYKRAEELVGTFNYYSTHVGGIVVTNKNDKLIERKNPSGGHKAPSKEILPLLCLDKNDIDKQKRFKMDILANTGLDIVNMVYGDKPLTEEFYPHDENVFDLIRKGETIGIVYGESPLVRSTFIEYNERFGLNSIEDIAKCLAMIRPMCRNENKDSDLVFDDDWIHEIAKTLKIDLDLADSYRKRLAKDDEDVKNLLLKGSSPLNKISPKRLKQLMNIKSYGFCKAHAMNYANLVYCQAYAKYHKPIEFHCAVINTLNSRIYNDWVYYYDALKRGVKIFANKRNDKYIIKNNCIQPKKGIQMTLKPLTIIEQIEQYGGISTLKDIEKYNLIGCSRRYKDVIFSCELVNGQFINTVKDLVIDDGNSFE